MKAGIVPIRWSRDLPIFASEPVLRLMGKDCGWIGGTDKTGKLRCILPYTVIRKGPFRMVRFQVETIPLGEELSLEDEKRFLDDAVRLFRARGESLVLPASNTTLFRTYPDGAIAVPYGSYIVDLTRSEEELWNDVRPEFKNHIRQARKKGVSIESGPQYLEAAFHHINETMGRSELNFASVSKFKMKVSSFGENVIVFAAVAANQVQGCMIAPFSDHAAYTLYSGRSLTALTGSMNLLRWEAMLHFRQMGVRRFNNTGVRINPDKGSKQEGLAKFKRGLGGKLIEGYMWKYPFNPLYYRMYCLAIRVLRGGDVVDLERRRAAQSSSSA